MSSGFLQLETDCDGLSFPLTDKSKGRSFVKKEMGEKKPTQKGADNLCKKTLELKQFFSSLNPSGQDK